MLHCSYILLRCIMNRLKQFLAIAALGILGGCHFHCILFCTDQTSIQTDYVEQRDRCRDYAQAKMDLASREAEGDKNHKALLVTLFSECMGKNGWTVPNGKEGEPKVAGAPQAAPVAPTTPASQATVGAAVVAAPVAATAASAAEERASLSRSAECDFARQNASVSGISAARAKACDLECEQRLEAAPEAPRPAACTAQSPAAYIRGVERP